MMNLTFECFVRCQEFVIPFQAGELEEVEVWYSVSAVQSLVYELHDSGETVVKTLDPCDEEQE